MRSLLCDYVGADRAEQVAHKTYVADELQKEENLTVEQLGNGSLTRTSCRLQGI